MAIIAFANFPAIWLFGVRNNLTLWLTGWDFGTYTNFHRWIARISTMQALTHAIGYTILIGKGTQLQPSRSRENLRPRPASLRMRIIRSSLTSLPRWRPLAAVVVVESVFLLCWHRCTCSSKPSLCLGRVNAANVAFAWMLNRFF